MKENDEQLRLITFVIFCGIILFGWQYFFAPPAPAPQGVQNHSSKEVVSNVGGEGINRGQVKEAISEEKRGTPNSNIISKEYQLKHNGHEVVFGSDFSILNMENKDNPYSYLSTVGEQQEFFFYLKEHNKILRTNFALKESRGNQLFLEDQDLGLELHLELLDDGFLSFELNSQKPYVFGTAMKSEAKESSNRHVREFLVHSTDVKRVSVGKEDDGAEFVNWYGVDFNYHLVAVVLNEKHPASFVMSKGGQMNLALNSPVQSLKGKIVFTTEHYDKLVAMGDGLNLAVDFGFFGILAVPILKGLQFFYDFFPNYGISIIILTFILRLITFPLQYKSFKSMKKMQDVQPEVSKIREKFKDDPQRMQQETMALFKRVGANPLSGCFPILLQMPIFIAFYKVLSSAMELVGAPFYFWIYDLSLKDPYYVLPILMVVTFFFQQRMTPTATVDPTQKKVMMIMPLFFGFIMKDLPAGLNLYMFVSSFLGIFQQLLVYRLSKR